MTHITNNNNNSIIVQVLNIHIQTKKLNMNKKLRTDQSNNNYLQCQRTNQSRERPLEALKEGGVESQKPFFLF